jgi:hypothetical protein
MPKSFNPWPLAFAILGAAGALAIYLQISSFESEADWEHFKQAHHCQSVGRQAGNNQGGWRCDDGEVHYRWRQQK